MAKSAMKMAKSPMKMDPKKVGIPKEKQTYSATRTTIAPDQMGTGLTRLGNMADKAVQKLKNKMSSAGAKADSFVRRNIYGKGNN